MPVIPHAVSLSRDLYVADVVLDQLSAGKKEEKEEKGKLDKLVYAMYSQKPLTRSQDDFIISNLSIEIKAGMLFLCELIRRLEMRKHELPSYATYFL